VDADEHRAPLAVGNGRALRQGHEVIPLARHDHAVTGTAQSFLHAFGGIEGVFLFHRPVDTSRAFVDAAVSGIQNHRAEASDASR
jgi:hypothetical protein